VDLRQLAWLQRRNTVHTGPVALSSRYIHGKALALILLVNGYAIGRTVLFKNSVSFGDRLP